MKEEQMALDNMILKFASGSHAYGTTTPNSDRDYIGIFMPNEEYILGNKVCESVEIRTNPSSSGKQNTKDDTDTILYSLPKYLKLLSANNPTVIETLFYPDNCVLFCNQLGQKLLDNRMLFPSKKVKWTFSGYAVSQKKSLTHKKERWEAIGKGLVKLEEWIQQGCTTLPQRLDLTSKLTEKGTWGIYEKGASCDYVQFHLLREVNSYGHRVEDLKKYGFSLKFASHLIRLLDEGLQFLVEGKLDLPLPNNNLVRDIKLGKYPLDQVLKMSEDREKLLDEAYVRSPLPHTPDLEAIEKLQISMLKEFWSYQVAAN